MVVERVILWVKPCLIKGESYTLYRCIVLKNINSRIENPAIDKLKYSKSLAQVYFDRVQILYGADWSKVCGRYSTIITNFRWAENNFCCTRDIEQGCWPNHEIWKHI